MKTLFEIRNLHAQVETLQILKGFDLKIQPGEIHAIMGPNGSGKSTLSKVIMGHPSYEVTAGDVIFEGESLNEKSPDERARKGIFMAFQHPKEIAGIKLSTFLRAAEKSVLAERGEKPESIIGFNKKLLGEMRELKIPEKFAERYINTGFSGGEKKKAEILQMKILKPKLIILDEIDSGLDVDALRAVAKAVMEFKDEHRAVLIITHYQRILEYINPDFVHVMVDGRVMKSGGKEFAKELEEKGYEQYVPASKEVKKVSALNVMN